MAEITIDDAKRMSCTKLTKLKLFHLVEADRGEPCTECARAIRKGKGDCGLCTEKVVPSLERSRRTKEKPAPAPSLKQYPLIRTSPLLATVDGAVMVYALCYAGRRVRERQGYEMPQLEHGTPLVLRLLDKSGKRVIDERRIVRMTGWDVVADDWERHLGVFGFDPRRVDQVYSIRGCDVVDDTVVTQQIRENLGKWSVGALVVLASQNGLIDELSVLCNCFTTLGGGVVALAHDPEAQKSYCGKLTRIVGDLFRTNLAEVTVATELLDLAQPVNWDKIQRSLLEGSLEKLASFCDVTGVRLPVRMVVSAHPNGQDRDRAAKIYAAADGTERTKAFMVTGAEEDGGRSRCRRLHFLLVFIDVHRSHSLSGQFWVSRRRICTHAAHEEGNLVDHQGDVPGRGARVYARFGRRFERGLAFRRGRWPSTR